MDQYPGLKKKYGNFHTFADPPPLSIENNILFFSIVDHYYIRDFFEIFKKFQKYLKGGTLGFFLENISKNI